MKIRSMVAVSLTAMFIAGAASAQSAQQERRGPGAREATPVSRADFIERRVAPLVAADANRDGQVTAEEMRAAREANRSRNAAARFARLDTDSNGVLSREEFAAAGQGRDGARRQARSPDHLRHARVRGEARTARADGARPQQAARDAAPRGPVVIAEARTRAGQQFDRMDADRNGILTPQERQAAHQAMREHRRQSRAAPASE